MNQFMFAKPHYDPLKDFTLIIQLARLPMAIIANDNTPVKSMQELIALAKQKPGTITIGGTGPILQVGVERFSRDAGVKLQYVPYRGGADVFKGLMSGEIALGFDAVTAYAPMFQTGKLRALATSGSQRAAAVPTVPSLAELGLKNSEFYVWHTLSGPAGMPPEIVRKIESDLKKVLGAPETQQKLVALGFEPMTSSSEQFVEAVKRESAAGSVIIKELGLRLD
jgi:tripartite-type tricarboxylate transporter receptor subunit TctC